MPTTPATHDPELDDLPPIDGDEGDAEGDRLRDEQDRRRDGPEPGEGNVESGGLDDSTSEDDPLGTREVDWDSLGDERGGWLDEPADNPALDIGDPALVGPTGPLGREDAPGAAASGDEAELPQTPDDDFAAAEGPAGLLDLTGEDGPVDPDEDLRDEDLPALDADGEESEAEEAGLLDERLARDESFGVSWSARPWARVGAPLALPSVVAVVAAARGALVAARAESGGWELLRVDLEGARERLAADGFNAGPVRALAVENDALAAVGDGGHAVMSWDGGGRFDPVPGAAAVADVALAAGTLWLRTKAGGLLSARAAVEGPALLRGSQLARPSIPGPVSCLTADGRGGVVALAVDAGGLPQGLVQGRPDGTVAWEGVEAGLLPAKAPAALVAARAGFVAVAAAGAVARRGPGGWQRAAFEGRITAISFVDDAGTLLLAIYSQSDDSTGLVELEPSGRFSLVARVGAVADDAESDGRVVAMACDDARGVVWVGGRFGLAVFARPITKG